MTFAGSHQSRITRRAPRGVALLLVLGVVAAASILSWAMLSSAALRAQLDDNAQSATASRYLADSGVSYAMYYLRNPEKSPVALTTGPYNTFYAGQHDLSLWEDAGGLVDVVVTNTAYNTFVILSTAEVDGITQVAEAEVTLTTIGYKADTAAAFNGPIQLPASATVSGLVAAVGSVTNSIGAAVTALGGQPVANRSLAVPHLSDLSIVSETGVVAPTGGSDRTYKIDGVRYVAEKAPTTITGTLMTARPALNPANVWWSDDDVVLNGATINGTLVVRSSVKGVELMGTNVVIAANPKLPALIIGKDLLMKHSLTKPAKLTAKGVSWIGSSVSVTGTTILSPGLTFEGSLLMASSAPRIPDQVGTLTTTHTVAAETVQLTEAKFITGIVVNRWSHPK